MTTIENAEPTYTLTLTEAQRQMVETALYVFVQSVEELAEDDVLEQARLFENLTPDNDDLLSIIFEARRLGNQTVRDSTEVANLHRRIDAVLKASPDEKHHDPEAEYDTPSRRQHRAFVNSLFDTRR